MLYGDVVNNACISNFQFSPSTYPQISVMYVVRKTRLKSVNLYHYGHSNIVVYTMSMTMCMTKLPTAIILYKWMFTNAYTKSDILRTYLTVRVDESWSQ